METWKVILLLVSLAHPASCAEQLKLSLVRRDTETFHAVVAEFWPPGMVPVFRVEKGGVTQWRRFPLRGQENNADAEFFGMPLAGEEAVLNGRWEVKATRNTEKPYLFWELAMSGTNFIGRFDRNTDYRFGTIAEGSFVANKFFMRAEYIQDAYLLNAVFTNRVLKGEWKRTDGEEGGLWEASQYAVILPPLTDLVELFEWQKGTNRVYLTAGKNPGEGWMRSEPALCRVWK